MFLQNAYNQVKIHNLGSHPAKKSGGFKSFVGNAFSHFTKNAFNTFHKNIHSHVVKPLLAKTLGTLSNGNVPTFTDFRQNATEALRNGFENFKDDVRNQAYTDINAVSNRGLGMLGDRLKQGHDVINERISQLGRNHQSMVNESVANLGNPINTMKRNYDEMRRYDHAGTHTALDGLDFLRKRHKND